MVCLSYSAETKCGMDRQMDIGKTKYPCCLTLGKDVKKLRTDWKWSRKLLGSYFYKNLTRRQRANVWRHIGSKACKPATLFLFLCDITQILN